MKNKLIRNVTLMAVSAVLIFFFSLCSTGGSGPSAPHGDGGSAWVVVWLSEENLGCTAEIDKDIFFSRSTDNGATWSAAQTLNSNADSDTRGDWFSEY